MKTYEPTPSRKTAFLGLGVMGHPMAGHLARAGHECHRLQPHARPRRRRGPSEYGGRAAPTPREAATGADFVFACVGNDDDLRSVVLGEQGAFAGMKPGAVFIDHTTASAAVARELSAAAAGQGLVVHRRAGVGRPGRCGERHADRDVRRRARGVRRDATGGDGVLARRHAGGRQRRRPAGQDGESGLHRRPRAGPVGRHRVRPEGGPGHEAGARGDRQGRRAKLADGQPRHDDGRRQVRLRLRGRLDAQGPRPRARRGAAATARTCRSPRWSTSSTATCRRWAAGAGTPRA